MNPLKLPLLAAVAAIVITTTMDFTGYFMFSALPLLGLGLVFWLIHRFSRAEIGLSLFQKSDYSGATKEFQAARRAVRRSLRSPSADDASPLLASVLNGLGLCAWGEGDFRKARNLFVETLEVLQ